MKNYLKSFFAIIFVLFFPSIVLAVEIIPSGCKIGEAKVDACGLNEVMQLFINVYDTGVQYVAVVTMLFLVIGGFVLLISGGRSNMVDAGKKILVGAFIGMFIVLTSYLLVRIIQVDILDANESYVIKDTRCSGKPNGTKCTRDEAGDPDFNGNYTCINNICTTITKCDYEEAKLNTMCYIADDGTPSSIKRTCRSRSSCADNGVIKNLCPGNTDNVCCYSKPEYNKCLQVK